MSGYLGFSSYDASKVMGLAAWGDPKVFRGQFEQIVRSDNDNYGVNQDFIGFHSNKYDKLATLIGPGRVEESDQLEPRHADIAAALQEATNAAVMALVRRIKRKLPSDNVCLAGGV